MRGLGWVLVMAGLAGCGGGASAEVGGSIGSTPFESVASVYSAGPYIILFDTEVDCIDTSWIQKTYTDGQDPAADVGIKFNALQFSADADSYQAGTFSVAGDSAVGAFGLLDTGETFSLERGRDGTLTVDDVADDGAITGSFDVAFTEGEVQGTFTTEYCRNMQP